MLLQNDIFLVHPLHHMQDLKMSGIIVLTLPYLPSPLYLTVTIVRNLMQLMSFVKMSSLLFYCFKSSLVHPLHHLEVFWLYKTYLSFQNIMK